MDICTWEPAPTIYDLTDNDVHVWCAWLDQSETTCQQLAQLLSPDERCRAEQYSFPFLHRRFIVARSVLRLILSSYTGHAPEQLQFTYGRHGKPALTGIPEDESVRFNVSHSQQFALYAVTRQRELGVDIEYVRRITNIVRFSKRFFSPREVEVLQSMPDTHKQTAFFNCWTRKEAYIKAIGTGLACPLDRFDVSLAPGEPARLIRVLDNARETERWTFHTLAPAAGYIGALAVEGSDWHVRSFRWDERATL